MYHCDTWRGFEMKKVIISAVLVCLLALPLVYIGCSNPSGGGRGGDVVLRASGENVVYALNLSSAGRSARSVTVGQTYQLKTTWAKDQTVAGPAAGFDSETMLVTVESGPTSIGNNPVRQRYSFRDEDGKTFSITFNPNGTMHSIQGLARSFNDELLVNPIGDRHLLDGAYIGFMLGMGEDGDPPYLMASSFSIKMAENKLVFLGYYTDPAKGGQPTEIIYHFTVTPSTSNGRQGTMNFAQEQLQRFPRQANHQPFICSDENSAMGLKTAAYSLVNNVLTVKFETFWWFQDGAEDVYQDLEISFRRAPD